MRDQRPWSGPAPPGAVHHFSPDRRGVFRGEHPRRHLKNSAGILQSLPGPDPGPTLVPASASSTSCGSTAPASSARPRAGRICAATSTTSGRRRSLPSPARRSTASARSDGRRARDRRPQRRRAPRRAGRSQRAQGRSPQDMGRGPARTPPRQGRPRKGLPLRPEALALLHVRGLTRRHQAPRSPSLLEDGRVAVDNSEPLFAIGSRTMASAERAMRPIGVGREPLALRGLRHRRRDPRPRHDPHRDRQDERPRPPGLARRRPRPHPPSPGPAPRRAPPLELVARHHPRSRRLSRGANRAVTAALRAMREHELSARVGPAAWSAQVRSP